MTETEFSPNKQSSPCPVRRDTPPHSVDGETELHRSPRVSVTYCRQRPRLPRAASPKGHRCSPKPRPRTSVLLCPGGDIRLDLPRSLLLYFPGLVTQGCLSVFSVSTPSDGVISQETSFSLVAFTVVSVSWAVYCKTQLASCDLRRPEGRAAKSSLGSETPVPLFGGAFPGIIA